MVILARERQTFKRLYQAVRREHRLGALQMSVPTIDYLDLHAGFAE